MDRDRIDIAALLPLESPEGGWGYLLTEDVVAARNRYFDMAPIWRQYRAGSRSA